MIYLSNDPYPQEISIPRSFGVIVPRRTEYLTRDDIVTDLQTDSDRKVLAASQGVRLKEMVDGKADANGVYTKQQTDDLLAGKQDTINDLQTIRDGAAAGATAYQKPQSGIPASDLAQGVIPAAVEANPTIPAGVTPTDLQNLKVGDGFFSIPQGGGGGGVDLSTDVAADRNSNQKASTPKSVFDALFKWGVISQTQTWTGNNQVGYDYTMSNQMSGLIPKANIDLYVSAGAVFNETTGYFELNGLTDISYEEMSNIYANWNKVLDAKVYLNTTIRTNLPFTGLNALQQYSTRKIITGTFQNSKTEIILWYDYARGYPSDCAYDGVTNYNHYLKKIIGRIVCGNATIANTAFKAESLEEIQIYGTKVSVPCFNACSRLSLASVVYMVDNAANTTAITITLHATAYARCQADTTEYTYNGQTYTGILAYASARDITIASA